MNQFTFSSSQKLFAGGLLALGVLCALITFFWFPEHHHARFWTNFLHNSVFFTGIAFITLYMLAAHTIAYSGWHTVLKRLMEAMTMFLPVGIILFGILTAGIIFHWHHLYHWAAEGITDVNSESYDSIIAGKSGLLNVTNYIILTVGLLSVWSIFAIATRRISLSQDKDSDGLATYQKSKKWYALFLPIGAFSSAFFIWLSTMSVDPHWYSTMFAWYNSASYLVSAVAIIALLLIYLNAKGYLNTVNQTHRHDVGKYLFAFSIFWTYLWFDQFMLIWYANIGEETIYFKTRMKYFPVIFYANILINFILPFLVLMRNSTKWKIGSLGFVATAVLFGHWLDFFMMIKPGILSEIHHGDLSHAPFQLGWHFPGLLEVGMALGFAGLFLFVVFSSMAKASLSAEQDPYFEESVHHHA